MKSNTLIFVLCSFLISGGLSSQVITSELNFTNCGQEGRYGPSQGDCDSEYSNTELDGLVSVNGGIQYWTVPLDGSYTVEVLGAEGGGSSPGQGARMKGDFQFTAGQQLKILVGQKGYSSSCSPGGGGTFVVADDNTPLIIAGGGGGMGYSYGQPGITSECGNNGAGNTNSCDGMGGTGNQGGNGAGFYTDAGGSYYTTTLARSFLNGGEGGYYSGYPSHVGGFGGGGASLPSMP